MCPFYRRPGDVRSTRSSLQPEHPQQLPSGVSQDRRVNKFGNANPQGLSRPPQIPQGFGPSQQGYQPQPPQHRHLTIHSGPSAPLMSGNAEHWEGSWWGSTLVTAPNRQQDITCPGVPGQSYQKIPWTHPYGQNTTAWPLGHINAFPGQSLVPGRPMYPQSHPQQYPSHCSPYPNHYPAAPQFSQPQTMSYQTYGPRAHGWDLPNHINQGPQPMYQGYPMPMNYSPNSMYQPAPQMPMRPLLGGNPIPGAASVSQQHRFATNRRPNRRPHPPTPTSSSRYPHLHTQRMDNSHIRTQPQRNPRPLNPEARIFYPDPTRRYPRLQNANRIPGSSYQPPTEPILSPVPYAPRPMPLWLQGDEDDPQGPQNREVNAETIPDYEDDQEMQSSRGVSNTFRSVFD